MFNKISEFHAKPIKRLQTINLFRISQTIMRINSIKYFIVHNLHDLEINHNSKARKSNIVLSTEVHIKTNMFPEIELN